jgi:DNA-binding CsgD family transcriptional regulator
VQIVGREHELDSLGAAVGGAADGFRALVLEGEPGIGKSTLWAATVEDARGRSLSVLAARPAEAEQRLPHVVLGDLLADVDRSVFAALVPPRRRALERALLLGEAAGDDAVDPRALGLAVGDVLQRLADPNPVLVAIDDAHWIDAASERALSFALRRFDARVVLLLSRRPRQTGEVERSLPAERIQHIPVGPFSVGALHQLLRNRLGRPFAHQTLRRIHETSAGNPFFALEIARVLDAQADPLEPLPLPDSLEELVRARLDDLPAATFDALALAAAIGTPHVSLLRRAGVDDSVLEPALRASVIERIGDRIRFTHPLLSSSLDRSLRGRRHRVHARVAEITEDPVVRARHLALAVDEADADTADHLERAAALAATRGAPGLAAELAEHALRLTPPAATAARDQRAAAAARAQHAAGEWIRAQKLAREVAETATDARTRIEARLLLADLEGVDRAAELLADARREATGLPELECEIDIRLSLALRFREGFESALTRARAALAHAEELRDEALHGRALITVAWLAASAGDSDAAEHAARARQIAVARGDDELLQEANGLLAQALREAGDPEAACAALERECAVWRDRDELVTASIRRELAWTELGAGRWEAAADDARRAQEVELQYGLEVPQHHLSVAWVAVHRGELVLAREQSERALALADEQLGLRPPYHLAVMGLVAAGEGRTPEAVEWLERADRTAEKLAWRNAANRPWTPDYVEALVEVGRTVDAARVLDRWEGDATRLAQRRFVVDVIRCRGVLAAAAGEPARAAALLEEAVRRHDELGDAFGRGRALLALGTARRRSRQKRSARDAIDAALVEFERLGARVWIDRARREQTSFSGRRRGEGLTAAERRVAALVVEGRTNREVATALFLTERTVASHLTHIYAKLNVRSRTELARRLA